MRLGRRTRRDRRARFFDGLAAETELVSVRAGELTFVVSTSDESVARKLFVSGARTEFSVLQRAIERVRGRGVFVDVGANIGTATLPALAHFERAIAVEPEPLNASLLRANVALNGFSDRVAIHQAACSSEPGEVLLRLADRKHGGHAVRTAKPGSRSLTVPAVTIDGVLATEGVAPADVGLVWMDVEGHEQHALAGASAVIAVRTPIVVEARGRTGSAVLELLEGHYDRFTDLRAEVELPLADLPAYLERLPATAGRSFTDILVVPG